MTCVKAMDPGLRRDDEFSMLFRNIEGRVQSHIPADATRNAREGESRYGIIS
jgi:hypothetical protein